MNIFKSIMMVLALAYSSSFIEGKILQSDNHARKVPEFHDQVDLVELARDLQKCAWYDVPCHTVTAVKDAANGIADFAENTVDALAKGVEAAGHLVLGTYCTLSRECVSGAACKNSYCFKI